MRVDSHRTKGRFGSLVSLRQDTWVKYKSRFLAVNLLHDFALRWRSDSLAFMPFSSTPHPTPPSAAVPVRDRRWPSGFEVVWLVTKLKTSNALGSHTSTNTQIGTKLLKTKMQNERYKAPSLGSSRSHIIDKHSGSCKTNLPGLRAGQ